MDLVFSPTSYFFPTLLGVSSVVQLLFLLSLFFSGSCHVRENGFLLERLIAAKVNFFSEKLVHKNKGGFLANMKARRLQKHFGECKKIIRQMTVGPVFFHGCHRLIR